MLQHVSESADIDEASVPGYKANQLTEDTWEGGCSGWCRLCTIESSARCGLCPFGQSTWTIPLESDSIRCLVLVESLGFYSVRPSVPCTALIPRYLFFSTSAGKRSVLYACVRGSDPYCFPCRLWTKEFLGWGGQKGLVGCTEEVGWWVSRTGPRKTCSLNGEGRVGCGR